MQRNVHQLQNDHYDLLVIGGGINGAAIAYLAACRGLNVALVEKGDFAGGTSSRSSKLIHGGIRYLENFQFGLVYESLRERCFHLQEAPHLVWPLRFLIPVYAGDRRPLWMMRCGVLLYDLLAGKNKIQAHQSLTSDEVRQFEPGLCTEGLKGGVIYYDAQMDDARLCLENVLCAAEQGAEVANYVEVVSFLKDAGRVTGVTARDVLSGAGAAPFEIRAKKIICAAGPWTNRLLKLDDPAARQRVRTTKGIHLVYPKKICQGGLLIPSRQDNRVFFVLPWLGNTLIGTTDTDYDGDPDEVKADSEDIEYLIRETRRVFPQLEIKPDEVGVTLAGLRPLATQPGHPSKVSREHVIFETGSGILFVTGGKYTTYRVIAEQAVDRVKKGESLKNRPLYGSGIVRHHPAEIAVRYGVRPETVRSLIDQYGTRYRNVLEIIRLDPSLKEKICPEIPVIKAQLVYSKKIEMACRADDILFRRLPLGYLAHKVRGGQDRILELISDICFKS